MAQESQAGDGEEGEGGGGEGGVTFEAPQIWLRRAKQEMERKAREEEVRVGEGWER